MSKKMKIMLVSVISIMCCAAILVVGVYALFTSQSSVNNHLQAGKLDIGLFRTNLVQTLLDEETGFLKTETVSGEVDFTKSSLNRDNIFGLAKETSIVPGSELKATLQVRPAEECKVAFSYWVEVKLDLSKVTETEYEKFSEQLSVTVSVDDGKTVTKKLSEGLTLGTEEDPLDTVALNDANGGKFVVSVKFDDVDDNDAAREQSVYFDLIVHAVQATQAKA